MGAWLQDPVSLLPYTLHTFRAVVVALEPNRWLLQTQSPGFIRFDHPVKKSWGPTFSTMKTTWSYPPRHTHPGLDESVQHGFQQVFGGSGHGGHEHFGDGAVAHNGGGALPSSKVRSDLPISTHTFGFSALGGLHASLQPAPSARKKQRGSRRPILHST